MFYRLNKLQLTCEIFEILGSSWFSSCTSLPRVVCSVLHKVSIRYTRGIIKRGIMYSIHQRLARATLHEHIREPLGFGASEVPEAQCLLVCVCVCLYVSACCAITKACPIMQHKGHVTLCIKVPAYAYIYTYGFIGSTVYVNHSYFL